jgi:hypothetical protein
MALNCISSAVMMTRGWLTEGVICDGFSGFGD